MIEKYEELVSALYLSCRDSSLGKVSDLKTECELLGLKVAEEELLLIQKVCLDSADVASALEKIKDITDRGTPEKFGEILKVVETDMRIREEQEERGRAETSKSKKMIEKEIKTKKKDFLELAQKANFHEHITAQLFLEKVQSIKYVRCKSFDKICPTDIFSTKCFRQ